jgi:hypothetical protein
MIFRWYPFTVMLAISAALWLKIDATEALIPEAPGRKPSWLRRVAILAASQLPCWLSSTA